MQSEITPTQPDMRSTTIRNYSLVSEARENRDAAMAAWTAAYRAYTESPTIPNQNALRIASKVHQEAQELYTSLHIRTKHNRGTVSLTPAGHQ